jgi:hypothetical protein
MQRLYLEGALALRAGDKDSALTAAAALEHEPGPEGLSAAQDLALVLRARIAVAANERQKALSLLERMPLRVSYPYAGALSRLPEQLLRSDLLLAEGREKEALRWAATYSFFNKWEPAYFAPVALALGRLYERAGRVDEAIDGYLAYVELRKECDVELRGELEMVKARLWALERKRGARTAGEKK